MASRFVIFLSVVLLIVGGTHFYFWSRLVRDTQVPFPYRPWASVALVTLAASLPFSFVMARRLSPDLARFFAWPAFLWMGFMFVLLVLLVGADLYRLAAFVGAKVTGQAVADPERRTMLARLLGGGAGLGAGLIGAAGVAAARSLVVRDVPVTLARLPRSQHGTTIVQITDLHVGPTIGRGFVEDVVRRVNALSPDIVAITGDLVDGSVADLWHAVAPLGTIKARKGIYFVTGNHEFYSGAQEWIEALGRLGIEVLGNRHVSIGTGADGFDLAGVHDFGGRGQQGTLAPNLTAALAGRDPTRELVLLAHQPRAIVEAANLGVGLQLSGHTHGGQIWPFNNFVKLAQPYVQGLHQHGSAQIYVSPGTGYWGPPMRIGTRAEITRIVLRSASLA